MARMVQPLTLFELGELFIFNIGFEGFNRGYLLGGPLAQSKACLTLDVLSDGEVVGFSEGVTDFGITELSLDLCR